jgi:hypothetical protein
MTVVHLTVHIPDELIERVKDKLPAPKMGLPEAVALDAILGSCTEARTDT